MQQNILPVSVANATREPKPPPTSDRRLYFLCWNGQALMIPDAPGKVELLVKGLRPMHNSTLCEEGIYEARATFTEFRQA